MLSDMQSPPMSRTAQYKKITKPLLERKRRARINRCLDELKDLMVGALEAEGENISKLEKADILELTVRHLQRLHRPRDAVEDAQRFQAGFGQCAAEACQFLLSLPGVDTRVGHNLLKHLGASIGNGPLTVQVPNRLCYSPPVSPPTPAYKPSPIQNALSSTPSVQDLSKPMTGLLMPVPKRNVAEINTKDVLRNSILKRKKAVMTGYGEQTPSVIVDGRSVVRLPSKRTPETVKNQDGDDGIEIDIENVEDDEMWRPW